MISIALAGALQGHTAASDQISIAPKVAIRATQAVRGGAWSYTEISDSFYFTQRLDLASPYRIEILLFYDLSALPPGEVISSAQLQSFARSWAFGSGNTDVYLAPALLPTDRPSLAEYKYAGTYYLSGSTPHYVSLTITDFADALGSNIPKYILARLSCSGSSIYVGASASFSGSKLLLGTSAAKLLHQHSSLLEAGSIVMRFATYSTFRYRLLTSLDSGSWVDLLPSFQGTGQFVSITNTVIRSEHLRRYVVLRE